MARVGLHRRLSLLDSKLLAVVVALTIFGIIMVYDSSSASAWESFGDRLYFVKNQMVWMVLGYIALLALSLTDYHRVIKFSPVLFWLCLVLLVVVIVPGIGTKALGARRWLTIAGFNFQPAEAVKFTFIIYLSALFRKKSSGLPFLFLVLLISALLLAEPDLGTAIVTVLTSLAVYFLAGAPLTQFLISVPLAALAGLMVILVSPYRRQRLLTFFNHQQDPLGTSYHVRQVLLAIGSGGLFGVGLGQSHQKYLFIPEVTTDSIFAVIAEELGFVGGLCLLAVFLWLFSRGLKIAKESGDTEGRLLAAAISILIFAQALINIAANAALIPLTGVPLPFISYGGSSLIVSLALIGVLLSISRSHG